MLFANRLFSVNLSVPRQKKFFINIYPCQTLLQLLQKRFINLYINTFLVYN